MSYSAETWVKAEDLDSSIHRLSNELYDLCMELVRAINCDDYCLDEDEVRRLGGDSERYSDGANLCNKYLHGIVDLEEFCEQLVQMGLKRFLYTIDEYLPKEMIEKYRLNQSDDKNEKDEEEDTHF